MSVPNMRVSAYIAQSHVSDHSNVQNGTNAAGAFFFFLLKSPDFAVLIPKHAKGATAKD